LFSHANLPSSGAQQYSPGLQQRGVDVGSQWGTEEQQSDPGHKRGALLPGAEISTSTNCRLKTLKPDPVCL